MREADDFRHAIRTGRSVLVVGTGVSKAATGDAKSDWAGLLRAGLRYAEAIHRIDPNLAELCREWLDHASTVDDYLEAATIITDALGGQSSAEFAAWLSRDVGNLRATSPRILESILGLGLPIVTTNYDNLLEKAGGRDHVTWMQPGQFQEVLAGRSQSIAHFHGYFTEPNSIVLSRESYALLLRDQNILQLRNAMTTVNSLVYVGFGDGLDDPNFASLRAWVSETLPTQTFKHFRLCRDQDVDRLQEAHSGEPVHVVGYGPTYDDLEPFLRGLETPGTLVQEFAPVQVLGRIEEQVRQSSIIGAQLSRDDQVLINDLLIPPALIPVDQEEFAASAKRRIPLDRPTRCDLREEMQRPTLIVAGDENSGVSSALVWLVANQHLEDPTLIPLTLNYRNLVAPRLRPLDIEIRKQLRQAGFSISDSATFPKMALAIDNVTVADQALLSKVVQELLETPFERVILGCRADSQIELYQAVTAAGFDTVVRHVGRLGKRDVTQLALMAGGSQSRVLAAKAIDLARAQHLPTTPFTFAMIISALLQSGSGSLLAATSQTTLLNAYVETLMGWGRQDDDSRTGMDSFNRSFIIEELAELYVVGRKGSLPQHEVIGHLTTRFEALEWPDSPIDALQDLEARKLLVIRGSEVAFTQSSYLHLFAAKRAVRSPQFLNMLRDDPLFFGPILQHYAALRRDDESLLRELAVMLEPFAEEEEFTTGIFAKGSVEEPSASSSQALARLELGMRDAAKGEDEEDDYIPMDQLPDRDVEPFPLEPIDDGPSIQRMIATLGLVSSVLRDTEIITDPSLRRSTLSDVLLGWSNFIYAVELDEDFKEFTTDLVEYVADRLNYNDARRNSLRRDLPEGLAFSYAVGGISANLSTQKLARSLHVCLTEPQFMEHVGRATMAVILAYDLQVAGWGGYFLELEERFGDTGAVDRGVGKLAQLALVRQTLDLKEESQLVEFLTRRSLTDTERHSDKGRVARTAESIRRSVLGARMTRKTPALPPGRSVLSTSELLDVDD